jgi:hypothetical protein
VLKPIEQMWQRVGVAKQDSDSALFNDLLLAGEFTLKLAAVGLLAGIPDDREKHRYRLAFKLVRADGLGDWASAMDDMLKGPASHHLCDPVKQVEKAEQHSPHAWLSLAALYEEEGSRQSLDEAKACIRRYLETNPKRSDISFEWKRLADLCERTNDFVGAVHALVEMCQHADVPYFVVSNAANKFNGLFRSGSLRLDTEEKRILIRRLAKVMSDRISEADADDYSRLAWLNLHLNDERRARELTEGGLRLDGENSHLKRLAEKFSLL